MFPPHRVESQPNVYPQSRPHFPRPVLGLLPVPAQELTCSKSRGVRTLVRGCLLKNLHYCPLFTSPMGPSHGRVTRFPGGTNVMARLCALNSCRPRYPLGIPGIRVRFCLAYRRKWSWVKMCRRRSNNFGLPTTSLKMAAFRWNR